MTDHAPLDYGAGLARKRGDSWPGSYCLALPEYGASEELDPLAAGANVPSP